MIKIKTSKNADTRSADNMVTRNMLERDTLSHIKDVQLGCKFISDMLLESGKKHDYTKIENLDEFYTDFISGKKGEEFKQLGWWNKHLNERHHLNDRVPEDVNLIDVLEMIIDGCMAGLARSGEVYDIEIDNEILQKALKNTQKMIISNTEVENDRWAW